MCAVAIAYKTGGFNPAKGLRQGHFDGSRFYGEQILDFTRLSRSVALRPAACRRRAHSGADAGNGHRTVLRGRNADQLIACAQRAQDQFATHSLTAPIGIERVSNTQCDDRLGRERLLAQDRPYVAGLLARDGHHKVYPGLHDDPCAANLRDTCAVHIPLKLAAIKHTKYRSLGPAERNGSWSYPERLTSSWLAEKE